MHSIRTRITLLTICAILFSVSVATIIGALLIKNLGSSDSNQMLLLLCNTGEKNLDYYFESVEQSVRTVANLVQESLDGADYGDLDGQVDRSRTLFEKAAAETPGVLTYYFRVDPEVSDTVKGFWYTNLDGDGFMEHEVTDITQYDTEDTSQLVWFTVPKYEGEPVWISPYITDNLDKRVISYNVPVYWNDQFFGVIGIELDYSMMAEETDHITLYDNGYAFITDSEGCLVYHPYIDAATLSEEDIPEAPDGLISDDTHVYYQYEDVEKEGVWRPLTNGMRLYVTVPLSEVNSEWHHLIWIILIASLIVLVIVSIFTMRYAGHLTKPLRELTTAAEQVDRGNYDFSLEYNKDDEVGTLTRTFKKLVEHLRIHINDLNKRANVDALTSVRNKGAYAEYIEVLQAKLDDPNENLEFAVCVFDCDDLKSVNDQYGHDKGDIYLKTASQIICRVFKHSPVFRIGGDEFSAILQNDDYQNRETLIHQFYKTSEEICSKTENRWEQVRVTLGMAVYDPQNDNAVIDTVRRADKDMYEYKRIRKKGLLPKTAEHVGTES